MKELKHGILWRLFQAPAELEYLAAENEKLTDSRDRNQDKCEVLLSQIAKLQNENIDLAVENNSLKQQMEEDIKCVADAKAVILESNKKDSEIAELKELLGKSQDNYEALHNLFFTSHEHTVALDNEHKKIACELHDVKIQNAKLAERLEERDYDYLKVVDESDELVAICRDCRIQNTH